MLLTIKHTRWVLVSFLNLAALLQYTFLKSNVRNTSKYIKQSISHTSTFEPNKQGTRLQHCSSFWMHWKIQDTPTLSPSPSFHNPLCIVAVAVAQPWNKREAYQHRWGLTASITHSQQLILHKHRFSDDMFGTKNQLPIAYIQFHAPKTPDNIKRKLKRWRKHINLTRARIM